MPKNAPKDDGRRAVSRAVTDRMHELGCTVAEISRRTGQSETTIYSVIQEKGQPTRSTLALLSAGLDWQIDHLDNILHGVPHENVVSPSPLEQNLAQLARGLTDIDTLRENVSELKDIVHSIDRKLDVVIAIQHASAEKGAGSE